MRIAVRMFMPMLIASRIPIPMIIAIRMYTFAYVQYLTFPSGHPMS